MVDAGQASGLAPLHVGACAVGVVTVIAEVGGDERVVGRGLHALQVVDQPGVQVLEADDVGVAVVGPVDHSGEVHERVMARRVLVVCPGPLGVVLHRGAAWVGAGHRAIVGRVLAEVLHVPLPAEAGRGQLVADAQA